MCLSFGPSLLAARMCLSFFPSVLAMMRLALLPAVVLVILVALVVLGSESGCQPHLRCCFWGSEAG